MKKTILTLAIAAVFAACNQKPTEEISAVKGTSMTDTTGYAQFQQWKENQDLIDPNAAEVNSNFNTDAIDESNAPSTATYSNAVAREYTPAPVSKPAVRKSVPRKVASSTRSSKSTQAESTTSTSGGTISNDGDVAVSTPAEAPVPEEKKGWSKAAKGTAIGAGSGAVLGAIISKNKTKGAVIGGIVGAAGGYVLGRSQDKKDGRY